MMRFLVISVGLAMLVGCNKSPDERIGKAQEKVIDAKAEAQAEKHEATQVVNEKQKELNKATSESGREVQASQEKVQDAREDMAKVEAEVAKDKADAQVKLTNKLRGFETRVVKLTQRPAISDIEAQSKFTQTVSMINLNLADARTKVGSFALVSPTEWQGPYETASNSLAKLEDSIQKAE